MGGQKRTASTRPQESSGSTSPSAKEDPFSAFAEVAPPFSNNGGFGDFPHSTAAGPATEHTATNDPFADLSAGAPPHFGQPQTQNTPLNNAFKFNETDADLIVVEEPNVPAASVEHESGGSSSSDGGIVFPSAPSTRSPGAEAAPVDPFAGLESSTDLSKHGIPCGVEDGSVLDAAGDPVSPRLLFPSVGTAVAERGGPLGGELVVRELGVGEVVAGEVAVESSGTDFVASGESSDFDGSGAFKVGGLGGLEEGGGFGSLSSHGGGIVSAPSPHPPVPGAEAAPAVDPFAGLESSKELDHGGPVFDNAGDPVSPRLLFGEGEGRELVVRELGVGEVVEGEVAVESSGTDFVASGESSDFEGRGIGAFAAGGGLEEGGFGSSFGGSFGEKNRFEEDGVVSGSPGASQDEDADFGSFDAPADYTFDKRAPQHNEDDFGSFGGFGSSAPAPQHGFDSFGSSAPAPQHDFDSFGSSAPAPDHTFDSFGDFGSAGGPTGPPQHLSSEPALQQIRESEITATSDNSESDPYADQPTAPHTQQLQQNITATSQDSNSDRSVDPYDDVGVGVVPREDEHRSGPFGNLGLTRERDAAGARVPSDYGGGGAAAVQQTFGGDSGGFGGDGFGSGGFGDEQGGSGDEDGFQGGGDEDGFFDDFQGGGDEDGFGAFAAPTDDNFGAPAELEGGFGDFGAAAEGDFGDFGAAADGVPSFGGTANFSSTFAKPGGTTTVSDSGEVVFEAAPPRPVVKVKSTIRKDFAAARTESIGKYLSGLPPPPGATTTTTSGGNGAAQSSAQSSVLLSLPREPELLDFGTRGEQDEEGHFETLKVSALEQLGIKDPQFLGTRVAVGVPRVFFERFLSENENDGCCLWEKRRERRLCYRRSLLFVGKRERRLLLLLLLLLHDVVLSVD